MKEAIIDRIEEQRHKKAFPFFSRIILASLVVSIIALAISPDILEDISAISLIIVSVVLILVILLQRYRMQKYGGQYVEWTKDSIIFKSRKLEPTTIAIDSIQDIEINFDDVVFLLEENKKVKFNFIDFHDVEDRQRIKSNFEKMKTMPNTL